MIGHYKTFTGALALLLMASIFTGCVSEGRKEYEEGVDLYEAEQYESAVQQFVMAADLGHARAQYELGACYFFGKGVEKDEKEAVKWYRRAAEQGDAAAQTNLGICYENGDGVPKNMKHKEHRGPRVL